MRPTRWAALATVALAVAWQFAPERPRIPVAGATATDWNHATFWHEPWGRSGVHKGIDIFAAKGTPVLAPTFGIVLFSGDIALGGKVVFALGPGWRVHYFAHLEETAAWPGQPIGTGSLIGRVGDSGNAAGRPPHLHYSIMTLLPRPWRADAAKQGWKKMFYLDPTGYLGG